MDGCSERRSLHTYCGSSSTYDLTFHGRFVQSHLHFSSHYTDAVSWRSDQNYKRSRNLSEIASWCSRHALSNSSALYQEAYKIKQILTFREGDSTRVTFKIWLPWMVPTVSPFVTKKRKESVVRWIMPSTANTFSLWSYSSSGMNAISKSVLGLQCSLMTTDFR